MVAIALSALAYGVTAWLTLHAVACPGTASAAIWPAAGIAVYCAHRWGPVYAGAGTLIGSASANIGFLLTGRPSAIAASILVGSGSATQAGLIAYDCRDARDAELLPRCALWCLLAPTVGCTALVMLGQVPESFGALSWLVWWIGDLAGVLLLYPYLRGFFPHA